MSDFLFTPRAMRRVRDFRTTPGPGSPLSRDGRGRVGEGGGSRKFFTGKQKFSSA